MKLIEAGLMYCGTRASKVPKIALLSLALLGVASAAARADETALGKSSATSAATGHDIVQKNCSRCHAIESKGSSPLAEAPPFRDVMKRYDPSELEEALAEGIMTGHNQMPEFTFEPDQITAIIAYLSTLRPK